MKKNWYSELQINDLLQSFTLFKYEKWSNRNSETNHITEYHIIVFFNKPYLVKTSYYGFNR